MFLPKAEAVFPYEVKASDVASRPKAFNRVKASIISSNWYGVSSANCSIIEKASCAPLADPVTVFKDPIRLSNSLFVCTIPLNADVSPRNPRYAPANDAACFRVLLKALAVLSKTFKLSFAGVMT